jgi:hypothetical protein
LLLYKQKDTKMVCNASSGPPHELMATAKRQIKTAQEETAQEDVGEMSFCQNNGRDLHIAVMSPAANKCSIQIQIELFARKRREVLTLGSEFLD